MSWVSVSVRGSILCVGRPRGQRPGYGPGTWDGGASGTISRPIASVVLAGQMRVFALAGALSVCLVGPSAAQIVPLWRIVTDVTVAICPLLVDGDLDAATRRAQAFGYRIDEEARPHPEAVGSAGRFVFLEGRHFDDLFLSVSEGMAWCAISLPQSTPGSVADVADVHLAALGYARASTQADRVSWTGDGREASAFRTLEARPRTTLALHFPYASDEQP